MTHTTSTRSLDDNKIIVGINKPQISLKPGETAKCEMTLINGGPTVDTLMITVIGLPASWVQVIQEVALKKGEPHKTDLVFCPPNSAECRAGEYSVVIAVRSTDRPDDIGTATLTLTIQPVLSFTAETAVTTQRSGHAEATYSFNATNSGNTHANIDFSTSSDNRALHLALVAPGRPSQTALSLPLEPGVTQLLRLNVQAPIHWIGRLRSHQARVRASVSGHEPKLLTFNFDQSALIPPIRTWAITGGLLLLAGMIALLIYRYRIQSPKIVWNVQPKPLILNESFSIGVTVPNAKTTNLKTAGGQVLATANGPVITYTGIATMPLTLIVVGENIISMDQASVELPLVNPTPQPTTAPILTPTAVPPTLFLLIENGFTLELGEEY